ncbi:MAG: ATP-binding protein [Planctomycetes bacterium]|nr:ATP-binding protein [Planctomycetota bacterium]
MFLGRDQEQGFLEELYGSGRPELFVLYGRRRVGKTELLQRFCEERRAVCFQAAQVREKDNLRAFRDALADGLKDELVASVEFPDWDAALLYAASRAETERLVLVLDEFPYLCEANKGLPSILQRFWDSKGKKSQLMLVLCGSQVSFMEEEVLAERSPLFGRRTAQRRLQPLSPSDALGFFDAWDFEDALTAYAILGGMPAYLTRFRTGLSLEENVVNEALRPEGYLHDEVQFLLKNELSNPATYNSILSAIARGERKLGDIALAIGVEGTTANRYLTVLRDLGIVERQIPITDPDPLRSRRGTYHLSDRFVAFHGRYVQPNLSLIAAGRGERVFREQVLPDLPLLLDDARTDFVLEHMAHHAADLLGTELLELGRHPGELIRAAARTADGRGVAGVLHPETKLDLDALTEEVGVLDRAFSGETHVVVYRTTADPRAPLEAEVVKRKVHS